MKNEKDFDVWNQATQKAYNATADSPFDWDTVIPEEQKKWDSSSGSQSDQQKIKSQTQASSQNPKFHQTEKGKDFRNLEFKRRLSAAQWILEKIRREFPDGFNIVPFQEAVFNAFPNPDSFTDEFYPMSQADYQNTLHQLSTPANPSLMVIPTFNYYKYVDSHSLQERQRISEKYAARATELVGHVSLRSLFKPQQLAHNFLNIQYKGYVKNKSVVIAGGRALWKTHKAYYMGEHIEINNDLFLYALGNGVMQPKTKIGIYQRETPVITIPENIQKTIRRLFRISMCADYSDWDPDPPEKIMNDHGRLLSLSATQPLDPGPLFRVLLSDSIDANCMDKIHNSSSAIIHADPLKDTARIIHPIEISPFCNLTQQIEFSQSFDLLQSRVLPVVTRFSSPQSSLPSRSGRSRFSPPTSSFQDPTGIFQVHSFNVKQILPNLFGSEYSQIWEKLFGTLCMSSS